MEILREWPIESIYTTLIKTKAPLILNPPLRILRKILDIPTLGTIFTEEREYEFLRIFSSSKVLIRTVGRRERLKRVMKAIDGMVWYS